MLLLLPFLPLMAALGFLIPSWRQVLFRLAPWTALPSLIIAVTGWERAMNIHWMLLHARMGMDLTGRVFLGFTALIWLLSGLYANSYLGRNKNLFFIFFLLAQAGNLGLILSYDVVSFYLFFALMSFSAYVLVVYTETEPAFRAGRVYIVLVLIGEILVFTALALSAHISNSLYFSDFAGTFASSPYLPYLIGFALFGFGIKAGLLPLHVWLPLAHPVAPTPASAVLSACMIKAGVLGWLRVFPMGGVSLPDWGEVIVFFGIFGAIYAALVGIVQKDVKTVLAYSSISQIGIITFLVGVGALYPLLWPQVQAVLLIYITAHALMKGALFLSAGVNIRSSKASMTMACLPALAMAGAPFMAGGVSKALMKEQVLPFIEPSYLEYFLEVTSYTTAFLMFRYLFLLFRNEKGGGQYVSWWLLIVIMLLSPVTLLYHFQLTTLFSLKQLFPIFTAIFAGMILIRYPLRISVPSGDLLVIYEWGISHCMVLARRTVSWVSQANSVFHQNLASAKWPQGRSLLQMEEALARFPVFGAFLIGLTILFFLLQLS